MKSKVFILLSFFIPVTKHLQTLGMLNKKIRKTNTIQKKFDNIICKLNKEKQKKTWLKKQKAKKKGNLRPKWDRPWRTEKKKKKAFDLQLLNKIKQSNISFIKKKKNNISDLNFQKKYTVTLKKRKTLTDKINIKQKLTIPQLAIIKCLKGYCHTAQSETSSFKILVELTKNKNIQKQIQKLAAKKNKNLIKLFEETFVQSKKKKKTKQIINRQDQIKTIIKNCNPKLDKFERKANLTLFDSETKKCRQKIVQKLFEPPKNI